MCEWCAVHPPWHERCTGEAGRWVHKPTGAGHKAWQYITEPCACECQQGRLW